MKKNRVVLPLIIFLLLCFLPCAIYGLYFKFTETSEMGNPNHLHKFEGKLYYYDDKDELIGVYTCKNTNCDNALTTIDDEYLKYYAGDNNTTDVFALEYAFIQDGDEIYLHNLRTNITITQLTSLKNYGTTIAGGEIIIKNANGLYGLFNMNNIAFDITPTYDFLGLIDNFDGTNLHTDKLVALKDNFWFLIDEQDNILSSKNPDPIYYYDDNFIYHVNNGNYLIYRYDGTKVLEDLLINNFDTVNNYQIINAGGSVYIYDYNYETIIQSYGEYGMVLTYEINDDVVNIYNGSTLVSSFDTASGELNN